MSVPQKSYYEIVDLFARTSSAEVLAFRPSIESQERVRYLLDRNESGELTGDEAAELERFGELEHLMQLVKARAQTLRDKLSPRSGRSKIAQHFSAGNRIALGLSP